MKNKIINKFLGTEEKKRLAGNVASLGILQGINYVLPLVTIPHLVRVLGPEYFGLLTFATATNTYFTIITDYGFNLSATRQVSIFRDSKEKVNEIFSSVLIIKLILMAISFGLMASLVFAVEKFTQQWVVYFLTFGSVVGQVLFPVWLFQGLERMKYITYVNIGTKVFFTFCIFTFVREQADYILPPLFTSLGALLAGVISLYFLKKDFGISFTWQNASSLKYQLVEGWHVFVSTLAISLYTTSTTFILGLFTNHSAVGYYGAADKIVQVVKGLYSPISQAFYPYISRMFNESRQDALAFCHRLLFRIGLVMFIVSVILFILAEPIVVFLFGEQFKQSVLLLKIISFTPFFVALSNIYGIQIMLNLGYKKAFSRVLIAAAALGVGLSLILVPRFESHGTAVTILLVEFLVVFFMFMYLKFWKKI